GPAGPARQCAGRTGWRGWTATRLSPRLAEPAAAKAGRSRSVWTHGKLCRSCGGRIDVDQTASPPLSRGSPAETDNRNATQHDLSCRPEGEILASAATRPRARA